MTKSELAKLRRIILRVIDDGCTCESGEKHPWEFYEDGTEGGNVDAYTEDMANANRLRFCDRIQELLTEESPVDYSQPHKFQLETQRTNYQVCKCGLSDSNAVHV
jgi:hypothetical protein